MVIAFENGNVRAHCPGCGGSLTTFLHKTDRELGSVAVHRNHIDARGTTYPRAVYQLLQCGGCGRGGLATVYCGNAMREGAVVEFHPICAQHEPLPGICPQEIVVEFREAELCMAHGANRAAAAMYRSALEKTLSANGYTKGRLIQKIDEAAADGLITEARKARAHDDVRSLGNDVLHEPWRQIDDQEISLAHRFTQRIIEDFYDDRPTAEGLLKAKQRLSG